MRAQFWSVRLFYQLKSNDTCACWSGGRETKGIEDRNQQMKARHGARESKALARAHAWPQNRVMLGCCQVRTRVCLQDRNSARTYSTHTSKKYIRTETMLDCVRPSLSRPCNYFALLAIFSDQPLARFIWGVRQPFLTAILLNL
jgi:hypothetical protein